MKNKCEIHFDNVCKSPEESGEEECETVDECVTEQEQVCKDHFQTVCDGEGRGGQWRKRRYFEVRFYVVASNIELCRRPYQSSLTFHPVDGSTFRCGHCLFRKIRENGRK
jgi:hypothetical protein